MPNMRIQIEPAWRFRNAEGRVFEFEKAAHVAQSVEHVLGKDEVTGSIPVGGSQYSTCTTEYVSK